MNALVQYADLVGGFLGIIGSIILGWPFVQEAKDRRQWELLKTFTQRVGRPLSEEERQATRALRDQLIDIRLGQHESYRRIAIWGFAFLIVAFLFMTIASVERSMSATVTH